jgi:rhodanese-related sulfurtransferase
MIEGAPRMEAQEIFERRDEVTFLDVREWYEWDAGAIEGSLHIPIRTLTERVDEIPRDRPVVAVCQVGQRSALASDFLNRIGYEAHNLEGGVEAWLARGFPLVSTKGEDGKIVDGWAQEPDLPT